MCAAIYEILMAIGGGKSKVRAFHVAGEKVGIMKRGEQLRTR